MAKADETISLAVDGLENSDRVAILRERLAGLQGLDDLTINPGAGVVSFRLNGQTGKIAPIIGLIESSGLKLPRRRQEIDIYTMRCAGCVATIENGLAKIPGITSAKVNFATQTGMVEYVEGIYSGERIVSDIKAIGYEAGYHVDDRAVGHTAAIGRDLLIALIAGAAILVLHMGQHFVRLFTIRHDFDALAQLLLTLPVLWAGRSIFADAFLQLKHFRANMNSLIALGSGTAFVYSVAGVYIIVSGSGHADIYFETTALIIAFILLGRYLEERATREARDAISGMASLIPQNAMRLNPDGTEEPVPVSDILIGQKIVIRPGQSIPADAIVTDGEALIDESLLTGESMPVARRSGEAVTGGTVNISGAFTAIVTRVGNGTVLARMIQMVREAQAGKAPIQRLADRVAAVFVPIVMAIALVTLLLWAIIDPDSKMLLLAPVAVLLVACPCALGLATPTAILVGTGRAARLGILFRSGEILEQAGQVTCVVFDKTGTLTLGRPVVDQILPADGVQPSELIRIAASVERFSEHPFAGAILAKAEEMKIEIEESTNFTHHAGQGVRAIIDGEPAAAGNREFVRQQGPAPSGFDISPEREKEAGSAVVHLAHGQRYLGAIVFSDTIKEDAAETVAQLKAGGREVVMVTGDNRYAAMAVAGKTGIKRVEAEALPQKKLAIIESLRRAGFVTAMIGDGVNDAAALAASDIGIALGTGADVAVKASDITIAGKSLIAVVTAFRLSAQTLRIIKQNLFWAFFYNIIMIPLAAGILYPVNGLVFSPVLAAAAMAASSVMVVANSLRLRRIRLS